MTSRWYKRINGVLTQIAGEPETSDNPAPFFVHQDTLKTPLRHPVTGTIHESYSKYMEDCRRTGTEPVGNELLSRKPDMRKDTITEAMVLDKIERAESILNDPSKYRARQNENMERLERYRRLVEGR